MFAKSRISRIHGSSNYKKLIKSFNFLMAYQFAISYILFCPDRLAVGHVNHRKDKMTLFNLKTKPVIKKSVMQAIPLRRAESHPDEEGIGWDSDGHTDDVEPVLLNPPDIRCTAVEPRSEDIKSDCVRRPESGSGFQAGETDESRTRAYTRAAGQIETAAMVNEPQIATSRRKLFKGAACLGGLQLVAGLASANQDYELVRLCAQFNRLERMSRELWEYENQECWADLFQKQEVLADKICALRPTTLEGFRALARAVTGWSVGMSDDDIEDMNGSDAQLLGFLMRHLVEITN